MIQAILNNLTHDISLLQLYIQNTKDTGFSDMTRLLESLSIKIFNSAFGFNLVNVNQLNPNFAAIDLADESKRVAIQITTTADTAKVKHTIDQFEKNNFQVKYDKLYIYGFTKCTKVRDLPSYCILVNNGDILSKLADENDEDRIQEVVDAIKQHTDFSRVHPYDDKRCFEIILGAIDRNAIKHQMKCEGSHSKMVQGLNEITEIISKGMIGKKHKGKCIDHFYDESIKSCLRKVRNDISSILSIVNQSRIDGMDFYNIDWDGMRRIDDLKGSIMFECNNKANDLGIDIRINHC